MNEVGEEELVKVSENSAIVRFMGKAQKHESNKRNRNLDAHGVLGSSQEVLNL